MLEAITKIEWETSRCDKWWMRLIRYTRTHYFAISLQSDEMLNIKWRPSKWIEHVLIHFSGKKYENTKNQQDRICLTFDLANLKLKHKIVVSKTKPMMNRMSVLVHAHTKQLQAHTHISNRLWCLAVVFLLFGKSDRMRLSLA